MLNRREFLRWTAGSLVVLGAPATANTVQARPLVPLAIVVARNSPIERISPFELKRLYLGSNLQAPSGERILAFHQGENAPERVVFERHVLGMESEELARYWIDRKIRGEGGAPRAVASVELLQRVVSRLPCAVSYLRSDQVGTELRVLRMDGSLPGNSGYLILGDDQQDTGTERARRDMDRDSAISRSLAEIAL